MGCIKILRVGSRCNFRNMSFESKRLTGKIRIPSNRTLIIFHGTDNLNDKCEEVEIVYKYSNINVKRTTSEFLISGDIPET